MVSQNDFLSELIPYWVPQSVLGPTPCVRFYLHLEAVISALQGPLEVCDVGVSQGQALDTTECHCSSRLNNNVATSDSDGWSLFTYGQRVTSE